jgi:DNA-binding transcriptional regulator YdaS (Cro superfamily)
MNAIPELKSLRGSPLYALAETLGINPIYLMQIRSGYRRASLPLALRIERETGISARILRPDFPWDDLAPKQTEPSTAAGRSNDPPLILSPAQGHSDATPPRNPTHS